HSGARWLGTAWLAGGLALYIVYRTTQGKSVTRRVLVPEAALRGERHEAEYGSILVPLTGSPLDDDIIQTAGRLAAEEDVEAFEGPSKSRGGALLGGRGGPLDDFVGEATKYVLSKAPCQIILTAPPASDAGVPVDAALRADRAAAREGAAAAARDGATPSDAA